MRSSCKVMIESRVSVSNTISLKTDVRVVVTEFVDEGFPVRMRVYVAALKGRAAP